MYKRQVQQEQGGGVGAGCGDVQGGPPLGVRKLAHAEQAMCIRDRDMGGTHTDAVLLRGGTLLASVKVPTNHQDLLVSTREALHALFESGAAFPADVSRATFGTTLAVNAVVQDACATVGC